MANTTLYNFGNLYDYSTTKGIVLPQTSDVKENIEKCFKSIFGDNFDTTPETIGGRLIEALTLLFVDVLGVNAQNATFLNPNYASGIYLDRIGEIWGVERGDASDSQYREMILAAQGSGVGFEKAITRAVSKVSGVTSVVVYNNGNPDPAVMPNETNGIAVDAHSVYICVGGGSDSDVANAIKDSISAGCGYTNAKNASDTDTEEYGTPVDVKWSDEETGSSCNVHFYRPIDKEIKVETTVVNVSHTKATLADDVKTLIDGYIFGNSTYGFTSHNANCVLTVAELAAAVAGQNIGAYIKDIKIYSKNTNGVFQGENDDCSQITFRPCNAAVLNADNNLVTII